MANIKRGEVELELYDKATKSVRPFLLRFDFNMICEIDNDLGEPLMRIAGQGRFGPHPLRECIYHALKKRNPRLSRSDVGGMIPGHKFLDHIKAVGEVVQEIMGINDAVAQMQDAEADPTEEAETPQTKEENSEDSIGTSSLE